MKKAIYPGSFDPITNGHMDILKRTLGLFDHVTLLLAVNPNKKSEFSVEERLALMKEATKDLDNVDVDFTSGFTVDYAKKHGSSHIIRGLRAITDFEYEFQLAAANSYLDNSVEMVFFMASNKTSFISSSTINEMSNNGADVSKLVPPCVNLALLKKRESNK